MIKCPTCHKTNSIISEPPGWTHKDEIIEISNYCTECETDFLTEHNISKQLKTTIVSIGNEYPFSA